jgi:hypothetical protein
MSAPVDVLAVMDGAKIYLSTSGWSPSPSMSRDFSEARAAVAKLIEAAEQAHAFLCEKAPATATEFRLRTSLTRVGGAA